MISEKTVSVLRPENLQEILTELVRKTVCELPEANEKALKEAYEREDDGSIAKAHLETNLHNLALSKKHGIPMCADTGFPVFFVRIGNLPGVDFAWIQECARKAVETATLKGYIRPNAVEPFTRENPNTNTGPWAPVMEWRIDPEIDYVEISYVPKGGGTEIFGPAFRTILVADGVKGLKKFIYDTLVVNGNRTGATCQPNIIGVGIGGTSEACMTMAKQAACLRKVGSRNPNPFYAALEEEMVKVVNEAGMGPLGMGGKTSILDLHIEVGYTHLVGTPVAIAAQCPAARVGTIRLYSDGKIEKVDWPGWFSY